MLNIINIYKELYSVTRQRFRLVLLWFVAGAIIGGLYFFADQTLLEKILSMFDDKFGPDPALSFALAMDIFLNNLQVSALALFGGLLFGLGPALIVLGNGFILGYILMSVTLISPDGVLKSLGILAVGLIPHGIIEIPAFLFASAIGISLGIDWLKQENAGKRMEVFKQSLIRVIKAIPLIILVLFLAALIEVFITGNLLEKITP